MKHLKLIVVLVLFGGLLTVTAQRRVVKVYPKHGTVVTKVNNPKIVNYNRVNFHFADGVWYRPQGKRFVVCAAPVGALVRHLPRGKKVVRLSNGRKLYKYKGVWYKKKGRGYVIVNV